MVLKNVFIAVIGTVLLAWSGVAAAETYRPGQFLRLDLSKAVLSPTPLGPSSQFTPGPLDVRVAGESEQAQASVPPAVKAIAAKPDPANPVAAEPHLVVHLPRVAHARAGKLAAHARAERPPGAARTKLARRHTNPLDAQAFDTRIQVWPCRTGGICDWKR